MSSPLFTVLINCFAAINPFVQSFCSFCLVAVTRMWYVVCKYKGPEETTQGDQHLAIYTFLKLTLAKVKLRFRISVRNYWDTCIVNLRGVPRD